MSFELCSDLLLLGYRSDKFKTVLFLWSRDMEYHSEDKERNSDKKNSWFLVT